MRIIFIAVLIVHINVLSRADAETTVCKHEDKDCQDGIISKAFCDAECEVTYGVTDHFKLESVTEEYPNFNFTSVTICSDVFGLDNVFVERWVVDDERNQSLIVIELPKVVDEANRVTTHKLPREFPIKVEKNDRSIFTDLIATVIYNGCGPIDLDSRSIYVYAGDMLQYPEVENLSGNSTDPYVNFVVNEIKTNLDVLTREAMFSKAIKYVEAVLDSIRCLSD